MIIEAIEKLLPDLFNITGPEATAIAARTAADQLLDLLEHLVESEITVNCD